ncbi:MAG: hypothetical protein JW982_07555 [Spirochaetes bacterium]|nr:hypothetical protein [Spirochaetota bacterium]
MEYFVVFVVLLAIKFILSGRSGKEFEPDFFKKLAAEYKLFYKEVPPGYESYLLSGKYKNCDLSAGVLSVEDDKYIISLKIEFEPSGLSVFKMINTELCEENGYEGEFKKVIVGDENFDSCFYVDSAEMTEAISLSDYKVRSSLLFLLNQSMQSLIVSNSEIRIVLELKSEGAKNRFIKIADRICRLSADIRKTKEIKKGLVRNIKHEIEEAVKIINFHALLEEYPESYSIKKLLPNIYSTDDYGNTCFLTDFTKLNSIVFQKAMKIVRILDLKNFENYLIAKLPEYFQFADEILDTLAVIGTVESVEPIHRYLLKHVNSRCHDAISAIQARLGNAEKGWVSIDSGNEMSGALSRNASPEKGSLSNTIKTIRRKKQ